MKNAFLCAAVVILASSFALGQQYKVLWTFGSIPSDGRNPLGSLVSDKSGNLYGTTQSGGTSTINLAGTAFELSPQSDGTWTETILHNFCSNYVNEMCPDGASPEANLIFDQAGNLYGTTTGGGGNPCPSGYPGCGTVFELSPPSAPGGTWTETVLYNFCSVVSEGDCLDGDKPVSGLTFDNQGNLYGTTTGGGSGAGGTVFELSPTVNGWTEQVLYNFCTNRNNRICPDGDQPMAGVTFDTAGNLYGTTMSGGAKNSQGSGTVYELSPGANGWTEAVILAFSPSGRGLAIPLGTVSFDPNGNLYSTASEAFPGGGIFELQPKAHTERTFLFNITDGSGPAAGVLVDPKIKTVYGTTVGGGTDNGGVVFQIGPSGQETVLYDFCQQTKCADGQYPYASLIKDAAGSLYGTASAGGINNGGVVFEITP